VSDAVLNIVSMMSVQPLACVAAFATVFIEPPRAFLVFALVQVLGQVIARRLSGRLRDRRAGTAVAS
jgi:hypothetical protein